MSDYSAKVLSVGALKRQHFDKSAPTPLVEVVLKMLESDARRIATDFDPARDASPSATDSREIARPVAVALVDAGLGG